VAVFAGCGGERVEQATSTADRQAGDDSTSDTAVTVERKKADASPSGVLLYEEYLRALRGNDRATMLAIVEREKAKIPAEIADLLTICDGMRSLPIRYVGAKGKTPLSLKDLQDIAQSMATVYAEVTGDASLKEQVDTHQLKVKGKALVSEALAALQAGESDRAIAVMEQALGVFRDIQDREDEMLALFNLGAVYVERGEYDLALQQYTQVLNWAKEVGLKEKAADVLLSMGVVSLRQGKRAEARQYFVQCIEMAKQSGSKEKLDQILAKLKPVMKNEPQIADNEQSAAMRAAIAKYEAIVANQPESTEANEKLALLYMQSGRLSEAIAIFSRFSEEHPKDVIWRANLASCYIRNGQHEDAIRHLKVASEIEPGHAGIHDLLGMAYLLNDQIDLAVAHGETAVRLAPNDSMAHVNLGLSYVSKGMDSNAEAEWRRALELDPSDRSAKKNINLLRERRLSLEGWKLRVIAEYGPGQREIYETPLK